MKVKAKHLRTNDMIFWEEGGKNIVEKVVTYLDTTKIYFKENNHTFECFTYEEFDVKKE